MSPAFSSDCSLIRCFPRVSGDEPIDVTMSPTVKQFSPRERG